MDTQEILRLFRTKTHQAFPLRIYHVRPASNDRQSPAGEFLNTGSLSLRHG
ncbi:hypothetical protein ASZ90_010605 [hydrocarbon metagenome]|uniref:Uncharacterized protein n=1 Tax=hydrocarbon metagenome TaxID=938273 RepID=A0A0W8FFU3_9ZZZZ|nr:hypothetical protein [Methanomicrobiaceae archaeon]